MRWQKVTTSVWLFRDSCNIYAVAGPDGMIVINAGTGLWLEHLDELPAPVRAVLCTHFFRDHSAGAVEAARRGIEIRAPYWEQEQFADPLGLFQRRKTYIIYDNLWDLFSPIEPVPVADWLLDYDTTTPPGGIAFTVIPTPGVTIGAISLICNVDGQKICFCGEAIHSPGRLARVAPLQYDYNDLNGAVNVIYSARELRKAAPDVLAPSLGDPILANTDAALELLEQNIRATLAPRPAYDELIEFLDVPPLTKVTDHVYQAAVGHASTWFVISASGKVLSIDYGYNMSVVRPSYAYPRHRRALLHSVDALREQFGVKGIDVALISHFHDDHVVGVPMLQRLFGTRCWAAENFAHILADPTGYNFPCTWPEPINVEPQPLGEPIQWAEYTFTLKPISGHTRWASLIAFEADGKRFMATGDQYFFFEGDTVDGAMPPMHNHVYRNGTEVDSLADSNRIVNDFQPEIILPGHGGAYETNESFFKGIELYARQYTDIHRSTMPLADDQPHFNVDSRAAWLEPYRTHMDTAEEIALRAIVRNPMPHASQLAVRLVGPSSWPGSSATVTAEPRAETPIDLTIKPLAGTICKRHPIALELTADGRPFGQVAEALVTIGHPVF